MNELINRPQHKSEQELRDDFVIRMSDFEKIMESIRSDAKGKMPQHIILQGQRGMGKTTLMYRTYYQVLADYRKNGIVPVIFSEEQYGIRTLYKLWEHIAAYLADNEEEYAGIQHEMEAASMDSDYEEKCFEILKRSVLKNDHQILLLIDNFGVMLDRFKKKEQQLFREILTTFPSIKIIGGTTVVLESFFRYDRPFFDFFKVIRLTPLNSQEVRLLLIRLGEKHNTDQVQKIIKTQPGRIEAMRILTGGVPRTIALLFNVFLDNNRGNSIQDLTFLLDRVTWLYKHRMDDLPPQQQEIVDKLALNWDGMSVSELVKKTRMQSKAISSLLNNLVKSGVVSASQSTGKIKYYQIEERFFNIWYLMQHAPKKSQRKVIWLTRFLEQWCPGEMLNDSATAFTERMRREALNPEYISTMAQAYSLADGLSVENRDDLLETAKDSIMKVGESLVKYRLPETSAETREKLDHLIAEKKYDQAVSVLNNFSFTSGEKQFILGVILQHQGKMDSAEEHYLNAVENGDSIAMFNLGWIYQNKKKDLKKAEKYYLMAVEKGDSVAMNNLANIYRIEKKDLKEAEKYYLMAVEEEDSDAAYNLITLAIEQNWPQYKSKSLAWLSKGIETGNKPKLNPLKAYYLLWADRTDEAISYLEALLPEIINEDKLDWVNEILMMAIAKGLQHYTYNLFQKEEYQLKDRLKILYYALMTLMQDEYPNEIKRMGKELTEPVNDMVFRLEAMEKKYA